MDGTIRYFEINGSAIKENNGKYFEIADSSYFTNLWIELDRIWVELNIK